MLNLHHLEHLIENLSRFGGISSLDASSYEQFNTCFNAVHSKSSK